MSTLDKRLERLEQKTPALRQFIGWEGNPWTPQQKKEAIRREPDRLIFWRSLLDHPDGQPTADS